MRYPNLRYGKHEEFRHYVGHRSVADVARELRRTERSVSDWLSGRQRVPFWVPELLRLKAFEHWQIVREMTWAMQNAKAAAAACANRAAAFPCAANDADFGRPRLVQPAPAADTATLAFK
ncbi:hypothetical protein [Burkholderia ubonensis]|uniref:hypothetical protein n=1 Tax=Burkholderia ubonensis TaxID=101571 RepID=UPI000A9AEFFA|nr:hypothetical protein [Burkholderia ubonensis]